MVYELKDQDVTPPEPDPDEARSARSDAFGADAIRPLCRSGRTLLRRGARRSPTAARGTPDEPRMVTDHGS